MVIIILSRFNICRRFAAAIHAPVASSGQPDKVYTPDSLTKKELDVFNGRSITGFSRRIIVSD